MLNLYNEDNVECMKRLWREDIRVDVVYADCIYESMDFLWAEYAYDLLKNDGIFYIQTDYHTVAEWKLFLDELFGRDNFINWIIYLQEWGGVSKRAFPKKHDDILMYSKGSNYKFYPERVQIPKVTAGTKLDKKGTGLKTPCDVFYDLGNFSTISKERVKDNSGKNIQWQKPLKLFERILGICTDDGDAVLDPFMGSGSSGEYCKLNNLDYFGIELDTEVFNIAKKRLDSLDSKI